MKIVCIAADLIPGKLGGAEHHCVEVIKRLSKRHEIELFVGKDTSIASAFNHNVMVHPIQYPRIPNLMGLAYILWGYFQIRTYLKKNDRPDLLWAKQSFPQAPLAALLKKTFDIPLYVTAQNPMLHKEELVMHGQLKYLQQFIANLLTPLIAWSLRRADMVAAVSAYSAKLARSMGAKKVVVVPNGIASAEFGVRSSGFGVRGSGRDREVKEKLGKIKDTQTNTAKSVFSILTVSSLIPRNGIDTLIEAAALLPADLDWKLIIAGDGAELQHLKTKSYKLKTKGNIRFLGRVDNQAIPTLLSQADVFVRPSRKEGFGVAFLEAMAAGVPVIATPIGGIPDFVTHKETGFLVEPDNPEQVSEAIKTLYSNKALRQKMIFKAQELVAQRYSWDTVADEVEATMLSLNPKP